MSDFVSAMATLFTFLFTQLGAFANWFLTNPLGQIILGLTLFSFFTYLITFIISKIRG